MNVKKHIFRRLDKFRRAMLDQELDAFLVAVPENRYYLSGYEAEDLNLTESSGVPVDWGRRKVSSDGLAVRRVREAGSSRFQSGHLQPRTAAGPSGTAIRLKTRRLGVEAHFLTHKRYVEVCDALKKACLRLKQCRPRTWSSSSG